MPKAANESMRTVRAPARPQPSRAIKHGWTPTGAKTEPSAMGAPKIAADLLSSPKKKSSGDGSIMPKQMVF